MANFNQHLDHALDNIAHLSFLNQERPDEFRWQLITVYYTAVQLMHAYVANKCNLHPETHQELKSLITPSSFMSTKLTGELFADYNNLEMKSRYARYNSNFIISEKHLQEAFEILEKIIVFFNSQFPNSKVNTFELYLSDQIKSTKCSYLKILDRQEKTEAAEEEEEEE